MRVQVKRRLINYNSRRWKNIAKFANARDTRSREWLVAHPDANNQPTLPQGHPEITVRKGIIAMLYADDPVAIVSLALLRAMWKTEDLQMWEVFIAYEGPFGYANCVREKRRLTMGAEDGYDHGRSLCCLCFGVEVSNPPQVL